MRSRVRRRLCSRPDAGASAVEYGLMIFAIAAMVATVVFSFGAIVGNKFTETSNCLVARGNGAPFPRCPDAGAPNP